MRLLLNFWRGSWVIAIATMKEAVRQPVFWLLLFIAVMLMIVNTFLPFFSLGDDVKMLKECGLATLLFTGLMLAAWTASQSIAAEIEGKTAMTLLSKPINRRQFILGKYVGILLALVIYYVPLIIVFLICVWYKVPYDALESARADYVVLESIIEVEHLLPGIVLIFLEVAVLSAISVAISTRLPMAVNMVSIVAIFVVGHMTPTLVKSGALKVDFVEQIGVGFFARLIATLLPALESFNIQAAISTGKQVPPQYLLTSAVYAASYSAAAILVAFILFEDRDLA